MCTELRYSINLAKYPVESLGQIARRRLFDAEKLKVQSIILTAKSGLMSVLALTRYKLRLARVSQGIVSVPQIGDWIGILRQRLHSHRRG